MRASTKRLAAQQAAIAPEIEDLLGPNEDTSTAEDEDPDGFDLQTEYGEDTEFSDGDPSERDGQYGEWDRADFACDTGEVVAPSTPDLVLRPGDKPRTWIAVLSTVSATGLQSFPPNFQETLLGRERTLLRISQSIVDEQSEYLTTLDPADLRDLRQKAVASLARVSQATVSRALENTWIELPDGATVRLHELVPDVDLVRARIIGEQFRQHDRVKRDAEGMVEEVEFTIPWAEVVRTVQRKIGRVKGNAESNVRRVAAKFGLPTDGAKRRQAYMQGDDWWTASS